jgi:hypothetical protein
LRSKAIRVPSGDQRGEASRFVPAVSRRGSVEPSIGSVQIALVYRFSSRSTPITTNATIVPSGDTRGSNAPVIS